MTLNIYDLAFVFSYYWLTSFLSMSFFLFKSLTVLVFFCVCAKIYIPRIYMALKQLKFTIYMHTLCIKRISSFYYQVFSCQLRHLVRCWRNNYNAEVGLRWSWLKCESQDKLPLSMVFEDIGWNIPKACNSISQG